MPSNWLPIGNAGRSGGNNRPKVGTGDVAYGSKPLTLNLGALLCVASLIRNCLRMWLYG